VRFVKVQSVNSEMGKMWKEAVMALFEVLYWHLPGISEESHEKSQTEYPDSERAGYGTCLGTI
jgi:hypothetical protein